jgi:hypothetical protein
MSEALSEEPSVRYIGLRRRTLQVWLCAGALGRSALGVEPGQPEAARSGADTAPPEHDRAERARGAAAREPAYGRAALEVLGVLAIGTAQYWMNVKTNSRDWDYPEWSRRFDASAVRFDNNTHVTNNVLHPLAGAAYYGLPRANGLGVGASALYTLAASTVWEWGLEWREKVSINDMFATTLGGIAIGEFLTQLGLYLNSAPSTAPAHDVAKATLGFPVWIHDRLDQRRPEPTARDRLGFSAAYRHRFAIAYENHWLESANQPGLELRGVTLEGSLVSLPRFLLPETFATSFAQGDFTTGSMGLHFDGHGLREADIRVEAVLAGYYAQRANPGVMGALLGLSTGFEFASKTTLKPGDEYALVHVFGPELRAVWKGEGYHFDVRLRAYADFAAIRCLAWPMVGVRDPEADFKSSLEQKYQYHAGVSSRISAALRLHAVRLSADLGFGSYRSIQGLDRFQEQITRDIPGTEVLDERRVEFALEPPGTLLRLYGELAANSHESSLGGEAGERKEQRWLLGAGVAF